MKRKDRRVRRDRLIDSIWGTEKRNPNTYLMALNKLNTELVMFASDSKWMIDWHRHRLKNGKKREVWICYPKRKRSENEAEAG